MTNRISAGILWATLALFIAGPLTGYTLSPTVFRERIARDLQRPDWESDAIAGRVIVHFRAGAEAPEQSRALAAAGPKTSVLDVNPLTDSRFVAVDPALPLGDAIQAIQNDPAVEWVQPVWKKKLAVVPNDSRFGEQWAFRNTGQTSYGYPIELSTSPGTSGSDAEAVTAWDRINNADPVIIAVIDTGADMTHPDLAANLWTNPGETPGDGFDNDGNGYKDDIHGFDFAAGRSGSTLLTDNDPSDANGHGTAVAGCALAVGNNGSGVTGAAWRGNLMVLKVMTPDGGIGDDSLVLAYAYAAANGAKIVNASYEGPYFSAEEFASIQALSVKGILLVAAAGNGDIDLNRIDNQSNPACYELPNILSVGATQRNDLLAWFSNYGGAKVDIVAPGEGILTTRPNYSLAAVTQTGVSTAAVYQYDDDDNGFYEYAASSGTSFSAPIVSGAAALLMALHPEFTLAQVRSRLVTSADSLPSLSPAAALGGGRLNLWNLLDFNHPHIAFASPAILIPGETTRVTLSGVNLAPNATVQFSGAGIASTVQYGLSSDTVLTVDVVVDPLVNQTARDVDITVSNPGGGSTTLPDGVRVEGYGSVYSEAVTAAIPDGNGQSLTRTLYVPASGTVADIDLHLNILHPRIGELKVVLKGPDGTQWTVVNRPGLYGSFGPDMTANLNTWFPSQSFPEDPLHPFTGKPMQGTWTLTVQDLSNGNQGSLSGWELRIAAAAAWTFDSSSQNYVAPTPSQASGSLSLRSASATNCFGYWHSEPNLTIPTNSLLRVGFTVATDVADPAKVPLYRLRLNSNDAQLALLHIMQRNGTGPQTPTPAGTPAEWFVAPPVPTAGLQTATPRYELGFDLLSFDPRMAADGQLTLRALTIERIALTSLGAATAEKTYTFTSGAEGWFQGFSTQFTAPTFTSTGGKLAMKASNSSSTYGIWTSPGDVALDPARLYRLRFNVASSSSLATVPTVRLRAGDSDQRQAVALVVNSKGDGAYVAGSGGKAYDVYYAPPEGLAAGPTLEAAFDMMNFEPSDNPKGDLSLLSLTVDSFPRP